MRTSARHELVEYEETMDTIVEEIGSEVEFKVEYEGLRQALDAFQNKAKELYPDLPWKFLR